MKNVKAKDLLFDRMEVIKNDEGDKTCIKFFGEKGTTDFMARGSIKVMTSKVKIEDESISDANVVTCEFSFKVNIQENNHFAGVLCVKREVVGVHKLKSDSLGLMLQRSGYELNSYLSTRLDEIITSEIKTAFQDNLKA